MAGVFMPLRFPKPPSPWDKYYSQQLGEGDPFPVGSAPGGKLLGQGTIPHFDGGFYGRDTGSGDWGAAWDAANKRADDAAQSALARLASGQFAGSPTGMLAANLYANPYGFDEAALQKQMRMAADNEAGSREAALQGMDEAAARSGFLDSASLIDSKGQVRLRSAQNLRDEQDRLFIEREKAKLAQQTAAGDLYARLAALEAEMNQGFAEFQGKRKFPIEAGAGAGGAGGSMDDALPGAAPGWKYLNARGEMIPFNADGTPLNDWQKEQALYERQQWVRQYSGGG